MRTRTRLGRFFHIALSRDGNVPLRAQLVTQITLHILTGVLKPGERLPSVRALARRLHIHHNTVSAAYGELAEKRLVEMRRGSGVYVSEATSNGQSELDGIIRSFLEAARKKGYSLQTIRAAVGKWLSRQSPDHILVIEPAHDLQQILVHELSQHLDCGISAATIEEIAAHTELLTGALTVATAYHAPELKQILPADSMLTTISLQAGQEEAKILKSLPVGSIVGLVSVGPIVLEYAEVVIASLRGDQLLVRPVLFNASSKWRALARAADIIIADSLCYDKIAPFARRSMKLTLIPPQISRYLRATLKNA